MFQMIFLDLVVVCPIRVLNKQCLISRKADSTIRDYDKRLWKRMLITKYCYARCIECTPISLDILFQPGPFVTLRSVAKFFNELCNQQVITLKW